VGATTEAIDIDLSCIIIYPPSSSLNRERPVNYTASYEISSKRIILPKHPGSGSTTNSKSEVIDSLRLAVVEFSVDHARSAAEEAVRIGIDPVEAVEDGLSKGVQEVGNRFAAGEAFLPELIMAGEAMKAGVEILRPAMLEKKLQRKSVGTVVIGTVRGDIHDIGKNILIIMLEAAGFNVIDLGADIAPEKFVDTAKESKAQFVAMSALLTTSTPEQKNSIEAMNRAGIRNRVKAIVGGAAVTPEWAHQIGADGYSDNATDAVELFKGLVSS
jgi:corrinoid protein of di/trimethylamine methyltransferase